MLSVILVSMLIASCQGISSRKDILASFTGPEQYQDENKSNTAQRSLTAIIVGGGPSGLATALALSPICQHITVIEKHEKFAKRGATFGLAPNGQKAIEAIIGEQYYNDIFVTVGMSTGGKNEKDKHDIASSLVFVWWELRDALLGCIQQQCSNVEILCGHEFIDIITENNDNNKQVVVEVLKREEDDNASTSKVKLKGDFLVAADGVHSQVRKCLHLPPILETNTTNFRGSFDIPLGSDDSTTSTTTKCSKQLRALVDKGIVPLALQYGGDMYFVLFNFHSKKPGRMAWILATQKSVDDDSMTPITIARDILADKSPQQLKLLEEIFAFSSDDHMKPYPKTSVVDFSDHILHTHYGDGGWGGKGRITLVGDAAHGMRPTDGYGGSMAFEDALVLARILKRGLDAKYNNPSSALDIPRLLKEYEKERRPRVKKVYDNQWQRYKQRMVDGKLLDPQDPEFLKWLFSDT